LSRVLQTAAEASAAWERDWHVDISMICIEYNRTFAVFIECSAPVALDRGITGHL